MCCGILNTWKLNHVQNVKKPRHLTNSISPIINTAKMDLITTVNTVEQAQPLNLIVVAIRSHAESQNVRQITMPRDYVETITPE
jgi:hypothetical protein